MGTRFNSRTIRTATAAVVGLVALAGQASQALATPGGKKAPEPKGCAEQCITKAWFTGKAPTLGLEVKTKVPAKLKVQASTHLPTKTATGPKFASVVASASSGNQLTTSWTSDFGLLEPGTSYHVLAWATDKNGKVAYRQGTIKTPPPPPAKDSAAGDGNLKTPGEGCELQCITKAKLNPAWGSASLEIQAAVPVRMQVKASKFAPMQTTSGPHFTVVHASASSGGDYRTQWTPALDDLEPATTYHIVVWATDEKGRTAVQQGTFKTHHANRQVTITFDRIRILGDADNGALNPGELELFFGVNGEWQPSLHQGERKVKSEDTLRLPWDGDRPGLTTILADAPQWLELDVQGYEHDKYGKGFGFGFCSQGFPPFAGSGDSFECGDYATATTRIDLDALFPGLAHRAVFETRRNYLKFVIEADVTVRYL